MSNEYVAARADILKSNLERMGVSNAVVLNESPARIADALPEFFDRVLVDAPCSGEGMFRKEPVARQQHCEALVKQCAELGAEILDCAAAVLPLESIVLETDCPYMAPEPVRGTRCDSSLIRYVGEYIAQLRGISAEEVFRTTAENARRVYGL